jgi:hypothetical protein
LGVSENNKRSDDSQPSNPPSASRPKRIHSHIHSNIEHRAEHPAAPALERPPKQLKPRNLRQFLTNPMIALKMGAVNVKLEQDGQFAISALDTNPPGRLTS